MSNSNSNLESSDSIDEESEGGSVEESDEESEEGSEEESEEGSEEESEEGTKRDEEVIEKQYEQFQSRNNIQDNEIDMRDIGSMNGGGNQQNSEDMKKKMNSEIQNLKLLINKPLNTNIQNVDIDFTSNATTKQTNPFVPENKSIIIPVKKNNDMSMQSSNIQNKPQIHMDKNNENRENNIYTQPSSPKPIIKKIKSKFIQIKKNPNEGNAIDYSNKKVSFY